MNDNVTVVGVGGWGGISDRQTDRSVEIVIKSVKNQGSCKLYHELQKGCVAQDARYIDRRR